MRWHLANQTHAIERAAISVWFGEQLPARILQTSINNMDSAASTAGFNVAEDVMEPIQLQSISIEIQKVALTPPMAGRRYRRTQGGLIHEELSIGRTSIRYLSADYPGWHLFRPRFIQLTQPALDSACSVVPLNRLKLEYWDRFIYDGDEIVPPYSEILDQNSELLPKMFTQRDDLWHAHVGYFEQSPYANKRLINLNVDIVDVEANPPISEDNGIQAANRSIGIYVLVEDRFVGLDGPRSSDNVVEIFEDTHMALKRALSKVVTKDIATRISLGV